MFTAQTATKYPYAGLVDLPVEILLQIVTYISPPSKSHLRLPFGYTLHRTNLRDGIRDLKNLTLSCMRLYDMLQPTLYTQSGQDDWYALRWGAFHGLTRTMEDAFLAGAPLNWVYDDVDDYHASSYCRCGRFDGGPAWSNNSVCCTLFYEKKPTGTRTGRNTLVPQLNWKVPIKLPLFECHAKARVLLSKHQRHDNCHCIPSFDSLNPVDPQSRLDCDEIPYAGYRIREVFDFLHEHRLPILSSHLDAETSMRVPPVIKAVRGLNPEAVRLIVQEGADPNARSHITDIFGLAATPRAVLSASGSSTLHVHNTADPAIPITQSISGAHKLGCHHICTSRDGRVAASAGFAGELKVWVVDKDTGEWVLHSEVTDQNSKAGETWAIALSEDGKFLAGTTYDGRINVWDIGEEGTPKIREYETGSPGSGSFGMSVDLSRDGKFTASGHQNGSVYLFNNDTGRLASSLPGLAKPVRAVAFSPGNTRLAAAGDSSIIAIYDLKHGEQVGNLTGHSSWITSIDWSDTGEYLLSGAMDGKVKVWSVERYACVATHSETDKALWSVKWLPKTGRSEMFCTAGANRSISFYREATGA
ncbi:Meiotic recombination protein rec14 [Colletotrichum sp. SAR11_239]|nr:Meiotic recombination protein rec14 [Colletotrichum sp. SAR11_239]